MLLLAKLHYHCKNIILNIKIVAYNHYHIYTISVMIFETCSILTIRLVVTFSTFKEINNGLKTVLAII